MPCKKHDIAHVFNITIHWNTYVNRDNIQLTYNFSFQLHNISVRMSTSSSIKYDTKLFSYAPKWTESAT